VARLRSVINLKENLDRLTRKNSELEATIAQRTAELAMSRLEVVLRLAKAAELRDPDTGNHVLRVGLFSKAVGEAMGLPSNLCDDLMLASTLHDVGKIAIPDEILRKTGPLTSEERATMKTHCQKGYRILSERDGDLMAFVPAALRADGKGSSLLQQAAEIARCHHEKWDGTGYPEQLVGRDIPFLARIVAVADVYDALRSPRPYKEAFSETVALEVMTATRGKHFDPEVFDAFVSSVEKVREVDRSMRTSPNSRGYIEVA
jgi:putative two-component system response regulator